jgi:hypothetical protein
MTKEEFKDWLNGPEFNNAMYDYRAVPGFFPKQVVENYEIVKKLIIEMLDNTNTKE